jgi:hypothetical protein
MVAQPDRATLRPTWTLCTVLIRRAELETQAFKRRVRRLKELGRTESLHPGYRLSPRSRAVLEALGEP